MDTNEFQKECERMKFKMILIQQEPVKSKDYRSLANEIIFDSGMFAYDINNIRNKSEHLAIESYKIYNGNSFVLENHLRILREADTTKLRASLVQFLNDLSKKLQELLVRFTKHMDLVFTSNDQFIIDYEEYMSVQGTAKYDYREVFNKIKLCTKDIENHVSIMMAIPNVSPDKLINADVFSLCKKYKREIIDSNKKPTTMTVGNLLELIDRTDEIIAKIKIAHNNILTSVAKINSTLSTVEDERFLDIINNKNKYIQAIIQAFNFIMQSVDFININMKKDVNEMIKLSAGE